MDARDRFILDYQAAQLEFALACHKVRAAVYNVQVQPRTVAFSFRLLAPARVPAVLRLAPDLALALGARDCTVRRLGAAFVAEVPWERAAVVHLPGLLRRLQVAGQAAPFSAVLGLSADDGTVLQIRLSSPEVAHILIAGTTGSGKTTLARSMLASLLASTSPRHLTVAVVDPKAHFADFAGLPHLAGPVATTPADWTSLILRLVAEMDARYESPAAGRRARHRFLLVIDELADVLDTTADPALEPALQRLAQLGRDAGIHLLLCTQRPSAAAVSSLITSNLPARLVGRVVKAEDARIATGRGGTGAERLGGRGDFIAVVGDRQLRFQAAYLDPADLPALIPAVRAARPSAAELPADSTSLRERVRRSLSIVTGATAAGGRPTTGVPAEAVHLAIDLAEANGQWPSAWSLRAAWAESRMDERDPRLPRNLRADKASAAIEEARATAEQNRTAAPAGAVATG